MIRATGQIRTDDRLHQQPTRYTEETPPSEGGACRSASSNQPHIAENPHLIVPQSYCRPAGDGQ